MPADACIRRVRCAIRGAGVGSPVASADPSSVATPAPVTDPLAPSVIPGLSEVEAIDGSVVLGMTAAGETLPYDLADGSTTVLDVGAEARPGDLSGGYAVGALPGDDTVSGSPVVYELATRTLRTIALDHGWGGLGRIATDGRLVVGTLALTNGDIQAAWVYHLRTPASSTGSISSRVAPVGGIADVQRWPDRRNVRRSTMTRRPTCTTSRPAMRRGSTRCSAGP